MSAATDRLTAEIARRVADGETQTEIAADLGLTQARISQYMSAAREAQSVALAADVTAAEGQTLSRRAGLPALPPPERDVLGRHLCSEEGCDAVASASGSVCEEHGGPSVRVALQDLVAPAVRRLGELVHSRDERVALAAANSVLSRTGYSERLQVDVTQARETLLERMMASRAQYLAEHPVLEGEVIETLDSDVL